MKYFGMLWGLLLLMFVQALAAFEPVVRVPHGSSEGTLKSGLLKTAVIAGGAAGNHTVTGIAPGDELVGVIVLDRNGTAANINLLGLTAEFTVTAVNTINNTGGTATSGDAILVVYMDLT